MPDRILAPRPIAWAMYALLALAGLAFWLTDDAESVRAIIGPWAPAVTGIMLVIGSLIGVAGSGARVYRLEVAAYPFLVGVWIVYAVAIGARSFQGPTPVGFALLLGAGAVALSIRGWELHKASLITRDLTRRQANRQLYDRQEVREVRERELED